MNEDVRLSAVAAGCFVAMLALGAYVAHRPLTPLDRASVGLRGHAMPLAQMFTRSGYWPALVGVGSVLCVAELIVRDGVGFTIVLAGTQLLSQAASNFAKETFKRLRPDDWLFHKELGFSFPSGHATTAAVFFGGLLLFVWSEPLPHPLQLAAGIVPAIWIAGIPWSRMALAAHYGTDVIGGLLFGAAWLCLMAVLLRHLPVTHVFV